MSADPITRNVMSTHLDSAPGGTSTGLAELDPTTGPPDTELLSVRGLKTHFFGDEGVTKAVDGVSFDIHSGKTLAIVGETGCGKSVTARSILRIVQPPGRIVSGEIMLRRRGQWVDLTTLPVNSQELRAVRGGEIGLVFQEPMASFSPVHTIGSQIVEAVRLHVQLSKTQARARALELLKMVRIPRAERTLDTYPWQLSGGLQQRAMIAMALAGEPNLLIADEPTTALDVSTQAQILELLRDLQRRTGMAIMLITHDLGVVAQVADEVIVMYLGRVVERGAVDDIFHAPKHPYTRALLRSIPSVHGAARVKLPAIVGTVPHPFNRPTGCSFHPRCPRVIPGLCADESPELRIIGRQEVSCHLSQAELDTPVVVGPDPELAPPGEAHLPDRTVRPEPTERGVLLEVRNLRKFFPIRASQLGRARGQVRAVDDVSFDLKERETLALVGESGSGKTTTSRCILRALDPDSGEVRLHTDTGSVVDLAGLSRRQLRPLRRQFQMVFQDPHSSLNPRMTVHDIVAEPLLVNGVGNRRERTERVEELLGLVGLRKEYLRRFPHAFSGGQRQRIGIARALALNPRLIVADEPVSALDVSVRAQILNLLLDLQDRLGLTYLFVSHDLTVVKHVSDRIAVMYVGQLVELGDRDQIISSPRHPYTASLLAAVPKPDPRERAAFSPPLGEAANPAQPPSGCYFHPRCPFAVEQCKVERPVWEEIAPGHRVRCHRARELELAAG
jgi:peptide/nickel transport system ATP-binding protein